MSVTQCYVKVVESVFRRRRDGRWSRGGPGPSAQALLATREVPGGLSRDIGSRSLEENLLRSRPKFLVPGRKERKVSLTGATDNPRVRAAPLLCHDFLSKLM